MNVDDFPGKFAGCHKLLFTLLTSQKFSGDDINFLFKKQSIRWLGWISSLTQILLLKGQLKKNILKIMEDCKSEKVKNIGQNAQFTISR